MRYLCLFIAIVAIAEPADGQLDAAYHGLAAVPASVESAVAASGARDSAPPGAIAAADIVAAAPPAAAPVGAGWLARSRLEQPRPLTATSQVVDSFLAERARSEGGETLSRPVLLCLLTLFVGWLGLRAARWLNCATVNPPTQILSRTGRIAVAIGPRTAASLPAMRQDESGAVVTVDSGGHRQLVDPSGGNRIRSRSGGYVTIAGDPTPTRNRKSA